MKKKLLSLVIAVAMLLALVVPASALENTDTVTVYVTNGMFTTGGIGQNQAYIGGIPTSDKIDTAYSISGRSLTIGEINNLLTTTQSVYDKPATVPTDFGTPNLLDAILTAFYTNTSDTHIDITDTSKLYAGWDSDPVEGEPGGYISYVSPKTPDYDYDVVTIDGVVYDKYSGYGWNIAYGTNASNIAVSSCYGTNVALTNGMIIVFDYSPYAIYVEQTNS